MPVGRGTLSIDVERLRQIHEEGWSAEHDDQWKHGELAIAAACYAAAGSGQSLAKGDGPIVIDDLTRTDSGDAWPWPDSWDKRNKHSRRRCLEIAGALLAAELDRLDRMEDS